MLHSMRAETEEGEFEGKPDLEVVRVVDFVIGEGVKIKMGHQHRS